MPTPPLGASPRAVVEATAQHLRRAESLVLLLDYDGTLVPFAPTPELAEPDPPLLALLGGLAARRDTAVHVVSGRLRDGLERWLGALPVWLHAEHGLWSRAPAGAWTCLEVPETGWREAVHRILLDFVERTPGSLLEEKTASMAWHYRMAEPRFGAAQAEALTLRLRAVLGDEPVEILQGAEVIEVRPHALHKGRLVELARARSAPGSLLVAVGDDRTDEDLFSALPPGSVAIHVGPLSSSAPVRLADVLAARAFLRSVLETG